MNTEERGEGSVGLLLWDWCSDTLAGDCDREDEVEGGGDMKEGESIDKSPKRLVIAPLFTSDCEGPTGDWKESNKESTEGKWGLGGRAFKGGCPVLKLPDTSPDTLLKTGLALMPETKLDGGALGGGGSTGGKGSGLIVSDRDSRGSSLSSSAALGTISERKLRSSDDNDIDEFGLVGSADRRRENRLRNRDTAEGAVAGALWDLSPYVSPPSAYVPVFVLLVFVFVREREDVEGGVAARSADTDTGVEGKEVGGVSVMGEVTLLPVDFFALSTLGRGDAAAEDVDGAVFEDDAVAGVVGILAVPGVDADDCFRPQKENIRLVVVCTFGAAGTSVV